MPKTHKHNLSHYRLMSGRMGELLPVSCIETLPGDQFRIQSSALLRLSPMVAPVMHPIYIRLHAFFVPNRIVWDQWEEFIVDMNTQLTVPTIGSGVTEGNVSDYLGYAPTEKSGIYNALPLYAYNKIWNEFFRDQDLDAERGEGTQVLARVRWGKDYFTTARTQAQSGASETVQIEFDEPVPIAGVGARTDLAPVANAFEVAESDGSTKTYAEAWPASSPGILFENILGAQDQLNLRIPPGTVAGNMDIQQWRRAMAWQRLSEHRNKYGSRYTDYLNFLGVHSGDARLQRPEYIGGGSATVSISEVLSTADTLNDVQQGTELGSLAGHGIAGHSTRPMRYFCREHGHIIVLASIRPKSIYSSAVHRNAYRQHPGDYWQKEMEIMGDQPVLTGEVHGDSTDPVSIFGYVDRHRDYREQFSGVAGEMRSTLNYWHLAREFTQDPTLNSSFVECNPTERIFAESITDTFQLMANHRVAARRLVSKRARI